MTWIVALLEKHLALARLVVLLLSNSLRQGHREEETQAT